MVASAKRKDVGAEPCAHEVRKASETTEVSGDAEGRSGGNADEQDDNKPAVFRSCTEDMLRSLLEESPMAIQALQAQGKLAVGRQADERPILANVGRRRTREREGDARADDRSKMQRTSLASGGCGARFGFPCWSPVTPEPDKHKNNQGSALSMGPADLVPRCGQFKSDLPVLGYAIPTWENRKPSALAGKTSPENTPLTMAVDYLKNVLDKSSPEGAAQERDPGEDDGDALVREQHWDATTDREFPESFHNTACKCVQVPCTPFPSHQEDYYEVEGYPDPYNEYSQPKQNLSTLDGRNMTSANTREDEADDWLRQPQSLPCGGDSECTPLIRQGRSLRYECVDRHANAGHAYHAVDQACPYQLSQGRAGMSKSSTHNGLSLDERARSFYPRSSSSRDMEGRSGLMQLIQMAARLEAQLQSSAVKLRTAQDLHMEQYSEIEKLKAACTLLHEENLRLRDALACISQGEGRKNMRAKESSIFSGGPTKAPKNAHGNKSRQNVQMSVPREEGRTESKDPSCSLKSVTREQGTQAHSHPVGRSRVANPADPIPVHKHQEDVCRTPSDAAGESNPPVSRAATIAN